MPESGEVTEIKILLKIVGITKITMRTGNAHLTD